MNNHYIMEKPEAFNLTTKDSLIKILQEIKKIVAGRLIAHLHTDKSIISTNIHDFCCVLDQLLYHLKNDDLISYVNVFKTIQNENVGRLVIKQRTEDKIVVKKIRDDLKEKHKELSKLLIEKINQEIAMTNKSTKE